MFCLTCYGEERKLKTIILRPPEELNISFSGNLVYTKAESLNGTDTLHYLISSYGSPTILVAKTDFDNSLKPINWTHFLSSSPEKSISFKKKPIFVYAAIFPTLYLFDDVNDTANISAYDEHSSNLDYPFGIYERDLPWVNVKSFSDLDENKVVFHINDTVYANDTGYLELMFQPFGKDGSSDSLPHMAVNSNVSLVQVLINNLSAPWVNHSRFALEVIFLASSENVSENTSSDMSISQSISDSHSPGVFESKTWYVKADAENEAYLQWNPIMYNSDKREIVSLNKVRDSATRTNYRRNSLNKYINSSIAFSYFGVDIDSNKVFVIGKNFTFGSPKDKFYKSKPYIAWTLTIGNGVPSAQVFPMVAIIIIAVGLGIPVLLILIGGFGVAIRHCKNRQTLAYRIIE